MLTNVDMVGRFKTREMSAWAEARGFRTRLVERRFAGDIALAEDDPRILFSGVDNAEARATLEYPHFDLVVDAGLGAGPREYLAMRLHTFPGPVTARTRWGEASSSRTADAKAVATTTAYQGLAAHGLDDCGLLEIASRTVGVPFVGVIAATLALTEIVRRLNQGPGLGVLDLNLRDLSATEGVEGPSLKRFNPGYTTLR
jgi:hypothetical protein